MSCSARSVASFLTDAKPSRIVLFAGQRRKNRETCETGWVRGNPGSPMFRAQGVRVDRVRFTEARLGVTPGSRPERPQQGGERSGNGRERFASPPNPLSCTERGSGRGGNPPEFLSFLPSPPPLRTGEGAGGVRQIVPPRAQNFPTSTSPAGSVPAGDGQGARQGSPAVEGQGVLLGEGE